MAEHIAGEIYPVRSVSPVHPGDPLHVGNFYRSTQRVHRKMMESRQEMILFLATVHREAIRCGMPRAFCRIPISLVRLRKWVYDYRSVFDYFFEVEQTGYKIDDKSREITIAIPKELPVVFHESIAHHKLVYVVPPLPDEGVVSKAYLLIENADLIRSKLIEHNRFDLSAPVEWLLSQPTNEVNFWFAPSGKLQLRDTSLWPIKAIETWPSWLRVLLFGAGIDIESAYTQYLLNVVKSSYSGRETTFTMMYPDLIESLENKTKWREQLCVDLGLPIDDASISIVKRVCMALANGAKVSGAILRSNSKHSCIKDLLVESIDDIQVLDLDKIGSRLSKLSREFMSARKQACLIETRLYPSTTNQKAVFRTYFQWEREARYAIWDAIGRVGIMVHDGIEGIPQSIISDAQNKLDSLRIMLS